MIVLDTSFLVAYANPNDRMHDAALAVGKDIAAGRHGPALLSEYIFDEFVTLLRSRYGSRLAVREGNRLLNDHVIRVVLTNRAIIDTAWTMFSRHSRMSFTDAIVVATAQYFGTREIASYDSDFDHVEGCRRVC